MARSLQLRFTKKTGPSGETFYDSNLVILNGQSGVHLDLEGFGNSVTILQSMTGQNFVTKHQDYFGPVWDHLLPYPGIGQVIKFRVNTMPILGFILGNIEDAGDEVEDPNDIQNAFGGSDAQFFMGKGGEYFLGKPV